MNRQHAIDSLVNIACTELSKQNLHIFLAEVVRNGYLGFTKMSNQKLEQELVYWGLKDCMTEDISEHDDHDVPVVELIQYREPD